MKANIHPTWYPEAVVICACGNSWTTGATQAELRTDICSACHPFYTGEQRIVDTEGQVDRFLKRLQQRDARIQEAEARVAARTPANLPPLINAPQLNPARALIKGVVCGVRVEDIQEPLIQTIRYLDKLIDELAKGKAMEKILRTAPIGEK